MNFVPLGVFPALSTEPGVIARLLLLTNFIKCEEGDTVNFVVYCLLLGH